MFTIIYYSFNISLRLSSLYRRYHEIKLLEIKVLNRRFNNHLVDIFQELVYFIVNYEK